jgi:predicted outer membrane repeat protein
MKISIGNKLMSGSRYAALALTVITSLAAGLWVSNAVAVEKIYHTDEGNTWVCGSATPGMVGILTEDPSYACVTDTLALDELRNAYIATWIMPEAYTQDTVILGGDVTAYFGSTQFIDPRLDMTFWLAYTTDDINFTDFSSATFPNVLMYEGDSTLPLSAVEVVVPAGSRLAVRLYNKYGEESSSVGLGTQGLVTADSGNTGTSTGSISFSVNEEDALCTLPVTNLSASDGTATSTTLTWTASSPNSDVYIVERDGSLIGTTTEQSFTDNNVEPNTGYNYVVRNSNTALACEGPDASITQIIPLISDQNTYDNNPIGPVTFTLPDLGSAVESVNVTFSSSNTTLLANNNIAMSGTGAERTLILTPEPGATASDPGQTGTTVVTITFDDGNQQLTTSFNASWYDAIVVGPVIGVNGVEHTDILSATNVAAGDVTIIVTDGVYKGAGNRSINIRSGDLTIRSENGWQSTTIDCENQDRAFLLGFDTSVIEGFTIQNCQPPLGETGSGANSGGAIAFAGFSTASIINNRFSRNFSAKGGAIYIAAESTPLIKGNSFINNSAGNGYGGAIFSQQNGFTTLVVENCEFENNSAYHGGAIYAPDVDQSNIDRSLFNFNKAFYGGAISTERPMTITRSRFHGNVSTSSGGAIYSPLVDQNVLKVSNSIFDRNKAGRGGGAISSRAVSVMNSSFYANTAKVGGAIYFSNDAKYTSLIENSILWGNSAEQAGNQIYISDVSPNLSLSVKYSVLQGGASNIGSVFALTLSNNLETDPLFALDGDLHVMPDSPTIDAGTNNPAGGLSATDYDGVSRSLDGDNDTVSRTDIGAFEFDPFNLNHLAVGSNSFRFKATINDSPPESQLLSLRNIGGGRTHWTISENIPWLRVDIESGTSSESLQNVRFFIDHSGLTHGTENAVVDIIDSSSGLLYHRLTVELNINDSLKVPSDFPTIQQAVDAAIDGDTVLVASGTYTSDLGDGLRRDKNIDPRGKAITIRSESGPETTIINSMGSGRGFKLQRAEDRNTIIEGFTIREGNPSPLIGTQATHGAGIVTGLNVAASFINLRLLNNTGSGISASGAIMVRNSVFEGNTNSGLYLQGGGDVVVIDSQFTSNIGYPAGGIISYTDDNLRIENSVFSKNTTNLDGYENSERVVGGVFITGSNVSLLNNVFEGNEGGIVIKNTNDANIVNNLLYNNAGPAVGGIFVESSQNVHVTNSTFYNNKITGGNAGTGNNLYNNSTNAASNTVYITNSIMGPAEQSGADIAADNNAHLIVSHSTISRYWAGGSGSTEFNDLPPMFRVIDLGADGIAGPNPGNAGIDDDTYDFRLDPASPMIDSGLKLSTLFSDIRGSVRPIDGNTNEPGAQFDRGAYEYSEYYGGIADDGVAKSLDNLSINGAQQVVGFEYVIHWDDKNPFPAGDRRISQTGEYDVNLALVSDAGLRLELDSFTVDVAAAGYNHYFTFAPEHIGDWKLRVELAEDPNQFAESADVFIRYKEVTEYSLGTEIIAPADADRTQKPDVDNESIVYWSIETNRLFAVGPGTTVVTWYADEQRENPIPVVAQLVYPTNPQLHIANTQPVTLLPSGSPFDAVETKYADNDASIGGNNFTASIEGWAVLLFRDSENPVLEKREKFEVVRSYSWDHNDPKVPINFDVPFFPLPGPTGSAIIGKAITDADHYPECKNGYAFFEDGFHDGLGVNKAYDRDTREGPIFAVNRDLTGDIQSPTSPQDDLVIVWYNQSPSTQVCWPSKPVRYDAQWPTDPEDFATIVIASAMGSGPLDPDTYGLSANMVIYNQPDDSVLGYNPNEEHAAFFTAQGSTYPGVFPLRSDLNKSDTSESYTLLKYREPLSNEWNMQVFKVVADSKRFRSASGSIMAASANDDRYCLNSIGSVTPQVSCVDASYYLDSDGKLVNSATPALCYQPTSVGGAIAATACPSVNSYSLNANGALQVSSTDPTSVEYSLDQHGVLVDKDIYYRFHYNAIAGSEINPPYPLNQLTFGSCTESYTNSLSVDEVLRDKDDKKFAYEGDTDVSLHYFYELLSGFYYPDKPVGSCVAWLEDLDGVVEENETPVETTYAVSWPDQVPTLFVGETLVDAKTQTGEPVGLPNIGDQCQVDVLYDAPIVNSAMNYSNYSVNLIDPLTEYSSDAYELADPENGLPGELKPKKDLSTGRWVFTALPYHLQSRLTYDEVDKQLKLKGSYSSGVGEPFLLMNTLTVRDIASITALLTGDPFNAKVEDVNLKAVQARDYPADQYASLKDAELKALSAGDAHGTGYVTLAFNNHEDCAAPTLLSVIKVGGPLYEGDIKVIESPNPFEEKVTLKHNGDFGGNADDRAFQWVFTTTKEPGIPCRPDDTDQSCTHNWQPYIPLPNVPETPATTTVGDEAEFFYDGAADTVIQGTGQQLLADKWFSVRYNHVVAGVPESISGWTAPQLYEGWIKRVMKKINLFDQKVKNFHATSANTTADMISLAGQPYEGPVALSDDPAYLQGLGIIELYETLLQRGNELAKGAVGDDLVAINQTLLFASTRLADLYMLLGNEAYGDAADPTIGFSVNSAVYGSKASSIFSFQNQTDSLLEEELTLLRGGDNAGIRPFYNRLVWNFTLGDGEVAYKENYNISDNNSDGEINEQDAIIQFPQGHGDAWGHYLSASKKYYELLTNDNYSWAPQSEAILVAGTPIEVDYRDERKFASVAAAKAKSGSEIVNLTYRDAFTADPDGQWQGYKDIDMTRAWGVDGWSRRAGQGALFDWVVGNAILPASAEAGSRTIIIEGGKTEFTLPYNETNPANPSLTVTRNDIPLDYDLQNNASNQPVVTITTPLTDGDTVIFAWVLEDVPASSIQRIDRTTVVELWDVVGSYQSIEAEVDKANAGLNPLGLVSDAVPFDIDPSAVAGGQTHFEQIYERAVQGMNNAIAVFNHANESSQLMRRQQDTLADFQRNVVNSEADYNNRLIEVYGYPYADDCGPGKTYATDYCNNGPDLYHYMYVDASKLMGLEQPKVHEFDVLMKAYGGVTALGVPLVTEQEVTFHVATDSRFGIIKPPTWSSRRKAPGEIQLARSELLQLRGRFDKAIGEYDDLVYSIELQTQLIKDQFGLNADEIRIMRNDIAIQQTLNSFIKVQRGMQVTFRTLANVARNVGDAVAESIPTSIGFSNDVGAPARSAIKNVAVGVGQVLDLQADVSSILELGHQQAKEITAAETSIRLATDRGEFAIKQQVLQIENMVRNEATLRLEMYTLAEGLQQSASRYLSVLAKGDRLLRDRLRIRTQTAAQIQDYRYKDMTFRLFRNDALQKYRAQFDMASMYVYLAAKAYDYETTLLDNSSLAGQHFLTDIIKQRSIGQIENGQPLTGSGLADPMKRMWQNFQVLKPQLGFNNPQQETNRFSLRQEMMRITLDTGSHATWRDALQASRVDNLWDNQDYRRYMRAFGSEGVAEPGLIIPFSTTVTPGLNFFRWPLGGGDSYYSSSNFATKISSVGVWFSNYNAVGLAQTPRIYLVPVGEDRLRTPSYDVNDIRTWHVVDQKLPAPFPIVDTEMKNDANWIPSVDTLFDEMFQIRRHSDFRAYHDSGYINQSELQYDSRLIGRSVWNSRWLLVIPGRSLLYDADEGLDTFIEGPESVFGTGRTGNGISDIKLFFETYSYSGN